METEHVNGKAKDQSFEDAIRDHLLENRARLVSGAVDQAVARISESMRYSAMDVAQTQLNGFFKTDVAPAVLKYLEDNREAIIASVIGTMKKIMDGVLEKHAEDQIKSLSESYKRSKFLEAIFGKSY